MVKTVLERGQAVLNALEAHEAELAVLALPEDHPVTISAGELHDRLNKVLRIVGIPLVPRETEIPDGTVALFSSNTGNKGGGGDDDGGN